MKSNNSSSKKGSSRYVDGFVIPIPKKKIEEYKKIARFAGKIWKEYGALEYIECAGDDLNIKMGMPFPKLAKVKDGETVVFSWIVYKSKAHRDSINKKVMNDPRIIKSMEKTTMPFDIKRMAYGGFKTLVEL